MRKIKENTINLMTFFIILTPIFTMIGNACGIDNFAIFFLPNLISLFFILFSIKWNKINIKKKEVILLIVFYLTSLVASLCSTHKIEAFLGNSYRLEGFITYISYLGFFYLGYLLKKNNILHKKIYTLILVCVTISILTLLKPDMIYSLFNQDSRAYYFYKGPFGHFNHFGYYLLIVNFCTIFMFFKSKKYTLLMFLLNSILLYTLVINDTFGCYVAYFITLIGLFIYFLIKKKYIKKILLVIMSFLLISGVTYRDGYNIVGRNIFGLYKDTNILVNNNIEEVYTVGTNRGELWLYALKFIKEKPWGYGFDNIKYEYNKNGIKQTKPHNLVLDMSLNSGILGMLAYFSLIGLLIIDAVKRRNSLDDYEMMSLIIVVSYLISSMFGNSTFYVSPYFYIFLGIMSVNYRGKKDELSI